VNTVLDKMMESKTSDQRKVVAENINNHPQEYEKILDQVFDSEGVSSEVKQQVLGFADLISSKLAIQTIERGIADSDSLIRIRGLQAAYRCRVDSLNDQILEILNNPKEEFGVRKWALHILASTDPVGYCKSLREIAKDSTEDTDLRKEAIFALTNVDDDETIGALCAVLGDSDVVIRQSGAWALSNISSPDSINCLLAALEDADEEVRDWSIRGLRDMDDSRALQGLSDAMMKFPPEEQVRLIRLVVERRSETILRAIAELLMSTDVRVRKIAAWAMGVSPYPPAAGNLELLLQDKDEQVQRYAKMALAALGRVDPTDFGFSLD
jgi:HEAT repeat protein